MKRIIIKVNQANNIDLPLWSISIVIAITGVLGWVMKQPSISKERY